MSKIKERKRFLYLILYAAITILSLDASSHTKKYLHMLG
jgi:hypothetical protein